MTIQHTTLAIQVSGASAQTASNTERQTNESRGQDSFQSTLSREMAQRQQAQRQAAAPAPTTPPPARPSNQNSAPATPQRAASNPAPAKPEQASSSPTPSAPESSASNAAAASPDGTVDAETAPDSVDTTAQAALDDAILVPVQTDAQASIEAQQSEALAAVSAPVNDMLALMASLTQPLARSNGALAPAAGISRAATGADSAASAAGVSGLAALEVDADQASSASLSAASSTQAQLGADLTESAPRAGNPALAAATQSNNFAALGEAARSAGASGAATQQDEQAPALQALRSATPALAQIQAQTNGASLVAGMDRIPARVGAQGWDNQIGQRIIYMVGKEQSATLTLNPPDLGPLQIVLSVSNDQASVAFSANQLEVRQALENALPRLREMLSESGLSLEQATVDAGASNQGQPGESRQSGRAGSALAGRDAEPDENAANEPVARATRTVAIGEHGTVDLFA